MEFRRRAESGKILLPAQARVETKTELTCADGVWQIKLGSRLLK